MRIDGRPMRTIWVGADGWSVEIIDQTKLPHLFEVAALRSMEDAAQAISQMAVRGAPLIGATAAYGVALAMREDASDASLEEAVAVLGATRPTAINLHWALNDMKVRLGAASPSDRLDLAYDRAAQICDEDVETCRLIGAHGLEIIRALAEKKDGAPVNILTHCNAGWLACIDWGTATSPIYQAHHEGIPVHVWVDETRPRNQGAFLTAFELGQEGVPHTIIVDNAGGHLMQKGKVDFCIVGTDRTTATGDVANKIGTYLKALAAADNGVPFYVALPHSTIDWSLEDGLADIPIEERDGREVTAMAGRIPSGEVVEVDIAAPGSPAANYGFDVTPARLVSGFVTERGLCDASREGLLSLYPERAREAS